MKKLIAGVLGAAVAAGACSLSKPGTSPIDGPQLTGPSEFALSLLVAASPDVVSQDGKSQSVLTVMARDANAQPVRGLSLRLAMYVGATNVDYGTLMSKVISTDIAGMASTIYTAPAPPPLTDTGDKALFIEVVPVGADYGNSTSRFVTIRLTRPGVILPPNPDVSASFFYSPAQPREDEAVQFDGAGSTGAGLLYAWAFGDGSTATGSRTSHVYSVAGNYSVVLKVTDDRGTSATSAPQVVAVLGAPDPTASFTISPIDPLVNDNVYFDGSPSTTPVGSGRAIVSYDWNFGDGAVGSGKTVSHKYGRAGTYTIVLNVKDSTGRRGTISKTVQVK